jgi:hypothetical protein
MLLTQNILTPMCQGKFVRILFIDKIIRTFK